MKKIPIYIVAATVLVLSICLFRPSQPVRPELLLADSLMQTAPDSSLHILQRLEKSREFTGQERALYALLLTQARIENKLPVESDSLIRIATGYFDQSPDSLRKARSNFYLGKVLHKKENDEKVLLCYQKALSAASKEHDDKLLTRIYLNMGRLLQFVKPNDEAIHYYGKALEHAAHSRDTSGQVHCLSDMGVGYTIRKEYDLAFSYYLQALQLAASYGDSSLLPNIYNRISVCYKQQKSYIRALKYVDKALTLPEASADKRHKYYLKSNILVEMGRYDSAVYYLEKSRTDDSFLDRAAYHLQKGRLEAKLNHYREAYVNLALYVVNADSLENKRKRHLMVELQKKYDYSLFRNENNELKIFRQRILIVVLLAGLVATVALFLFLYFYRRKKAIKKALKNEIEGIRESLVCQRIYLMQEQAAEIMDRENRFLREKHEQEKQLSQKQSALEMQLEKVQELKEHICKRDAVIRKIHAFSALKPNSNNTPETGFILSPSELGELEEAVDLCFGKFATRLRARFPKLRDDDVCLCCLIKLEIPAKSQLVLLDISEQTLKKRKYRIKRDKMELPDSVVSLDDFLKIF